MTSRELVHATLEFRNKEGRVPRELWTLPWSDVRYPETLAKIKRDYASDFAMAPNIIKNPIVTQGAFSQRAITLMNGDVILPIWRRVLSVRSRTQL